jgi:hypothetical protein
VSAVVKKGIMHKYVVFRIPPFPLFRGGIYKTIIQKMVSLKINNENQIID